MTIPTVGAPGVGSRVGVRPSAVNDAVLLPGHGGTPQRVLPTDFHSPDSSRCALSTNTPDDSPGTVVPTNTTFPIVLRYVDKDVQELIAKRLPMYVAVEALRWQPLPMTPSTDSFYTLLELPAGNHNYRFIFDGNELVDSTQAMAPMESSSRAITSTAGAVESVPVTTPLPKPVPARDGKPANTIHLNEVLLTTSEDDDIMDSGAGWGQEEIIFEESRKYPPIVPLHLRYTPLNTPPTLVRCARDGRMSVVSGTSPVGAAGGATDPNLTRLHPEHLPLPLSVTINHVYFQRREDHIVMGTTTRYCNKFATVVYYTHLPGHAQHPSVDMSA